MFPTLRLLVGTVFASVVALSCGFGVFAAFRVNHDPLSRLPASTAPLQLVADETVRPPVNWGAPLRAPFADTQTGGAPVTSPTAAPVRRTAMEVPDAAAAEPARAEPATAVPQSSVPQAPQPPAAARPNAPATADVPAPTAAPAPAMTAPAEQTATAEPKPAAPAPMIKQDAAVTPAATQDASVTAAPKGDVTATAAVKQNATAKSVAPASPAIPQVAAAEPSKIQAVPAAKPADITSSVSETALLETPPLPMARPKPPARIARKAVERRRVAVKRRVTRQARAPAPARSGDGNAGFREPVFQSAPNFQQPEAQSRDSGSVAKNSAADNSTGWPGAQ